MKWADCAPAGHASLIEPVQVEAYGQSMPLNQVATISVPSRGSLPVPVWDKSMVNAVDKRSAMPISDFRQPLKVRILRIRIPELNEQRRKEMVKVAHKYARTPASRFAMCAAMGSTSEEAAEGQGDQRGRRKAPRGEVQKTTDQAIDEIDTALAAKEKEIMQV